MSDLWKLNVDDWRTKAHNRWEWMKTVEADKSLYGL